MKAEMYRRGVDYKTACQKLLSLLGEDREIWLQNDNDGEIARLSRSSVGKLLSNDAVHKSTGNGFTREQHYAAASDIDSLFTNSYKI